MDIILASTSIYRQRLLERLELPFRCMPPGVDETALPEERPAALAARLAEAKAEAISVQYPDALVIGSDQVAALGDTLLGKPGNFERAYQQLRQCAGHSVRFSTGLALRCQSRGIDTVMVEPFDVAFRPLEDREIQRYLEIEQPYDCAGAFKVEGLGISLFTGLHGRDPTSLEGLPLMALSQELRALGLLYQ